MVDAHGTSPFGPALLLGVGLGGFVDGIVLHQILGWHHMLSSRPNVDTTANLAADGLFHAVTWLAVLIGVLWLWRRRSRGHTPVGGWALLAGPMVMGWGLFNLGEGVLSHHLLELHHVRPGSAQTAYDVAFLVVGGALLLGGLSWYRYGLGRSRPVPTSNPP